MDFVLWAIYSVFIGYCCKRNVCLCLCLFMGLCSCLDGNQEGSRRTMNVFMGEPQPCVQGPVVMTWGITLLKMLLIYCLHLNKCSLH